MQTLPVTTLLRDLWDEAIDDGVVCPAEITLITDYIARADDGTRLAVAAMRGGPNIRRVRRVRDEYTSLHGPLDIEEYRQKRQVAEDGPDAA